jgi:hypothetical protein
VEAVKPRLGHVRHYIPIRAKHVIRKWPGDEIHVRYALELVLGGNFLPECTLIRHVLREANWLWISNCHVEDRGDFGPEITPSEIVAIGNVEGFISASLICRSPQRCVCKKRRLSHLIDRVVGTRFALKAQRQTEFSRDSSIDRDCREDAHWRAW